MLEKINKFGKTKFFSKGAKPLQTNQSDKFFSLLFPDELPKNQGIYGGARYSGLFKNSLNEFPLISIVMPNFKEKNLSDGVNYTNFGNKYGNIQYIDLLLRKK